jgi:hypothetical protein
VSFVAYLVPAMSRSKNTFFAAEFQVLLVLGSILSVRMLIANGPRWHVRRLGTIVLAGMTLWGLWIWRMPSLWGISGDPVPLNNTRVVESIERILFDHAEPGAEVFVTAGGPVSSGTLNYISRQDGRRLNVTDLDLADNSNIAKMLDRYQREIDRADFVVAAEPGVAEFADWHPSTKMLADTLGLVRDDDWFKMVGTVKSRSGKLFYIFERMAFGGWDSIENLDTIEGPYPPPLNLPKVRWGLYPATVLVVHADSAGTYRLVATGRSPMADQTMSVLVDGDLIGTVPFAAVDVFQRTDLPTVLGAGDHRIELRFGKFLKAGDGDPRERAVLFSGLRIDPPDAGSSTRPAGN